MNQQQDFTLGTDDVEVFETEHCHDGFFKLDRLRLRHRKFDGDWSEEIAREVIHRKNAVGVLAYDPDLDAVCLVQQFRCTILGLSPSPWAYELIAGLIDRPGETETEVAVRESREEAGLTVDYLEKINSYWVSIGGSNERMSLYLGLTSLENVGGIHGAEDESEDIRALVVAREEAEQWAFTCGQSNAACIIAMQWLKNERHRLQSIWQNGL
ncbi:MAG: NUDIX domain-containing protein [Pseudomonadales bacterium]